MQMKLQAGITTIINGETGVGKTCLVRYLSQMIEGSVFTLNVHAGRTQKNIIDWI
jgi:Cdc6-like AAA superfamily ATPase